MTESQAVQSYEESVKNLVFRSGECLNLNSNTLNCIIKSGAPKLSNRNRLHFSILKHNLLSE